MIDLGHQNRRLVLKLRPLCNKILFRVFAGTVLKIQIAQVLIKLFLALLQIIQPRLFPLAGKHVLRPEGVNEQRHHQQRARNFALQCCHLKSLRLRFPGESARGVPALRDQGSRHLPSQPEFYLLTSAAPAESFPAAPRQTPRREQSTPPGQIRASLARPAQSRHTCRQTNREYPCRWSRPRCPSAIRPTLPTNSGSPRDCIRQESVRNRTCTSADDSDCYTANSRP